MPHHSSTISSPEKAKKPEESRSTPQPMFIDNLGQTVRAEPARVKLARMRRGPAPLLLDYSSTNTKSLRAVEGRENEHLLPERPNRVAIPKSDSNKYAAQRVLLEGNSARHQIGGKVRSINFQDFDMEVKGWESTNPNDAYPAASFLLE
jgi:hypothetical protein